MTAVEWGAGLVEHLARSHLRVDIARPVGDEARDVRQVRFIPSGLDWPDLLGPARADNLDPSR